MCDHNQKVWASLKRSYLRQYTDFSNCMWKLLNILPNLYTLHWHTDEQMNSNNGWCQSSNILAEKHPWTPFLSSAIHVCVLAEFIKIKGVRRVQRRVTPWPLHHCVARGRGIACVSKCVFVCVYACVPACFKGSLLDKISAVTLFQAGCRLAGFWSGDEPLIWDR